MARKAVLLNLTLEPAARPPRLAGLPVLLRAVLSAQRAGIEELVISGGNDPAAVLRDKRVKLAWRWVAADGGDELSALRAAQSELGENFVLCFADSMADATAFASLRAAALNGKAARRACLPGNSASGAASLYLCGPDFVRQLGDASGRVDDAAAARLGERGLLDTVAVEGRLWPRTSRREELRAIHRELAHFSLKPSDGIYARFNKLVVAEPLIRFVLRTPASPNFITALGLLFAIASGWLFAQGGYWWFLAASLLAYVSCIMDHVDGMVARLKFQESEFGVWFESAVDYASYLFIFSGFAVGLWRERGEPHHLLVGALFIFGAVMTFIVMAHQRQRIAADNPTDYPNRVHRRVDTEPQNFFLWFGRQSYFVARRAVLPYYIFLCCLLDLRVFLLSMVALGANLFWLLTLYSWRLFRAPKPSAAAGPAT